MRPVSRWGVLAALCSSMLLGCSHSALRLPASARPKYNPHRVQLLRNAAASGIFIEIADEVIRDVPSRAAGEQCRKIGEAPWANQLFYVLEVFERDPSLLGKVHLIELRRGDRPAAEISKDLDGAVSLVVSYQKVESHEKIASPAELPCTGDDTINAGSEVVVTRFDYPTPAQVAAALRKEGERPNVPRLNVDSRFPQWLAERLAVFRFTPDLAFEKTSAGEPLLPWVMSKLATQIDSINDSEQLEYWFAEIGRRSRLGGSLKFFGLKKDSAGGRGIQVDTLGKIARKMNGGGDPTYLYLSYRVENHEYTMTGLPDLGRCLSDLSAMYRSAMNLMSSLDSDPDSFLAPGYHCQNNEISN